MRFTTTQGSYLLEKRGASSNGVKRTKMRFWNLCSANLALSAWTWCWFSLALLDGVLLDFDTLVSCSEFEREQTCRQVQDIHNLRYRHNESSKLSEISMTGSPFDVFVCSVLLDWILWWSDPWSEQQCWYVPKVRVVRQGKHAVLLVPLPSYAAVCWMYIYRYIWWSVFQHFCLMLDVFL